MQGISVAPYPTVLQRKTARIASRISPAPVFLAARADAHAGETSAADALRADGLGIQC